MTPVAAVIVAAMLGVGFSGVTGPTFLFCPVVIGELGPRGIPSAPQLGVSDTVQSLLKENSDAVVTFFSFGDKVLHNLTPRVPEGEFWESTGQQDSMVLFLFLEF